MKFSRFVLHRVAYCAQNEKNLYCKLARSTYLARNLWLLGWWNIVEYRMRLPTVSHAELPIPIHNINVHSHRVHILRWIDVRLLRRWNICVVSPPSNNDIDSRSGCVVNQFVEITCDDVLSRASAFDIPSMTSVRRSFEEKKGNEKNEAYRKSLEKSEWWKKDGKIRPRLCFFVVFSCRWHWSFF